MHAGRLLPAVLEEQQAAVHATDGPWRRSPLPEHFAALRPARMAKLHASCTQSRCSCSARPAPLTGRPTCAAAESMLTDCRSSSVRSPGGSRRRLPGEGGRSSPRACGIAGGNVSSGKRGPGGTCASCEWCSHQ